MPRPGVDVAVGAEAATSEIDLSVVPSAHDAGPVGLVAVASLGVMTGRCLRPLGQWTSEHVRPLW